MVHLNKLFTSASIIAMALAANNPLRTPEWGTHILAGDSYTITWTPTSPGNVDLILRFGDPQNLETAYTIAANVPNAGRWDWPVSASALSREDYVVEIRDVGDRQPNYSPRFAIVGSGTTITTVVIGAIPTEEAVEIGSSEVLLSETESAEAALPEASGSLSLVSPIKGSEKINEVNDPRTQSASSSSASSDQLTGELTTDTNTQSAKTATATATQRSTFSGTTIFTRESSSGKASQSGNSTSSGMNGMNSDASSSTSRRIRKSSSTASEGSRTRSPAEASASSTSKIKGAAATTPLGEAAILGAAAVYAIALL